MNRKILVAMLAVPILLSIYAGLTMAKPKPVSAPLVLLGNFSGYFNSNSVGDNYVSDAWIRTDRPAKFTVSVGASSLDGPPTDTVTFGAEEIPGESSRTWVPIQIYTSDSQWKSFTYVGYGSSLEYNDQGTPGMTIWWCIMVEGEAGTVVSFTPPF
jgi:hypothetical protein